MRQTVCFGLHPAKNVVAIQINVGHLLLHETVDGDETKLLDAGVVDAF